MCRQYVTAAYACAVLHFWTARIRNWRGRSELLESIHSLAEQPLKAETMADEKVLARVHDKRQRTLKAIANLWSLVLDIFLAALFVSQLWSTSVSSIKTLPLFVGVAGGNVILHRLCRPDLKLTPERLTRDTTIMTLLVFVSSVGLPREFLPSLTMARVMVSSFATDAPLSNKVNLALTPLYILSHWCQNWTATSGDQLIFTVCSEGIILSFLSLAITNLDVKEYQLAAATIELEEKVQQVREAEAQKHQCKCPCELHCCSLAVLMLFTAECCRRHEPCTCRTGTARHHPARRRSDQVFNLDPQPFPTRNPTDEMRFAIATSPVSFRPWSQTSAKVATAEPTIDVVV
ncbi:unnamed protein product [Symbiodinium sp. CCMP2592]|nr:unnamed protein product [Symbiodinium sp. CCMP2592]